jgi:hypothetical protein
VAKCLADGQRRLRGMELTMAETFALEQPSLLSLPARPYACCTVHPVQPDGLGLVSFQTNRYSVPEDHTHEALWLRAFVDRVEIGNGRQTLAVHPRCYEREQDILNPLHYLTALEQRPGAFEQAKPIQQWQKHWPEVYNRYLAALREHLSSPSEAIREFVRILQLHRSYSEELIAQALEQALAAHCFSVDGVKQLIQRLTEPTQPAEPLNLAHWPHLNRVQVSWPDMSQFDRLLGGQAGGVA